MAPEISVIIPVYNAEKYLRPCLDSVLDQTFSDIEVLCIDDGSTDGSGKILQEYAERDSRVHLLHQENAGAGAARNTGLRAAAGTYLSFLDADDFFEPDMLRLASEKAKADRADFVVFRSDQYYTEENCCREMRWTLREQDLPSETPFSRREIRGNVFKVFVGWAWDKLYSREFIWRNRLLFQEQRTSNDLFFVFAATALAERISIVNRVLAHQRRDAGDSLSKTRENSWFCFHDALTALRERLCEEGIFEELEQDFINYTVHASLWNISTLAEPSRSKLIEKMKNEWEREFGIKGKRILYFYDKKEFLRYKAALRT